MYYDHQLTDKLDELAKMVAERIAELESDDDWDINIDNKYRLLRKFDEFYDDCLYTSMCDI
jgi:hypothetical protein